MNNVDKTKNKDLQKNIFKLDDENTDTKEISETNYVGVFLPIGTGLGVTFGVIFDNLAMGISLGTSLGLLIGAIIESMKKKK